MTVELIRNYVVGYPWNLLGNSQVDNVPLSRIATVTGVYGLSFEIALVNTVFAATFLVHKTRRKAMIAAALVSSIALQSERFVRLEPIPTDAQATLVQQNVPIRDDWNYETYDKLLKELATISVAPTNPSGTPGLIVWPESPAPFFLNDGRFMEEVSGIAKKNNAYVVAGSIGLRSESKGLPDEIYNSAAVISPQGALAARYDKVHLVPFGEYVPFRRWLSFAKALTGEVGNFVAGNDRSPRDASGDTGQESSSVTNRCSRMKCESLRRMVLTIS